jgi:hypothetical protein
MKYLLTFLILATPAAWAQDTTAAPEADAGDGVAVTGGFALPFVPSDTDVAHLQLAETHQRTVMEPRLR